MNDRNSLVSGTETFLRDFDQEKDIRQNIDRNKHNEERGGKDDNDDDDYGDLSSSSEESE